MDDFVCIIEKTFPRSGFEEAWFSLYIREGEYCMAMPLLDCFDRREQIVKALTRFGEARGHSPSTIRG